MVAEIGVKSRNANSHQKLEIKKLNPPRASEDMWPCQHLGCD